MISRAQPPLRLVPRPAEVPYSVLQRLARRHNCIDVAMLQEIIDLRSYNSRNAHVTGKTIKQIYDHGILPKNEIDDSIIYAKNGGTFVGLRCLSQIYAPRRLLELGPVCLTCLEDDVRSESKYSGPMTYRRWYWDLNYLDICAHHHHRLLRICPQCRERLSWKSLDPRYCNCGADLLQWINHAIESTASEAQRYIADVTLGREASGSGPLATLAPKEVQDLTVRLALQIRPSKTNTPYDLAPRANDEFQDQAFYALKQWPDGFDELLDAVRAKSPSTKSHINEAYGSIYRWLTRRRYKCYDPVSQRIALKYEASISNEKPRKLFKVVPRTVKQMSLQKLSQELCAPRSLLFYIQKLVAEECGETHVERNWMTDDEVLYARMLFGKLVDKKFIKANVTRNERNIRSLVFAGILECFSPGSGSKPYYFADAAQYLAGIIAKARKMGNKGSKNDISLAKICRMTGRPMAYYITGIMDRSMRIVGHDGGADGLSGLLLEKVDFDAAQIGFWTKINSL